MTGSRPHDGDARRRLFAELVDFAGLFPPAALSMAESVRRYDEYRRGSEAWALGKFVLPVSRLEEFGLALQELPAGEAWQLAAVAGREFGADVRAIDDFVRRTWPRAIVGAIEVRAASAEDVAAIARNAALLRLNVPDTFDTYVEVPVAADPSPLIEAIAAHGLRAKVRTGGVEPGAFPTAEQLARFIVACTARGVTFKATAGLHHAMRGAYPLTYEPSSERGAMFGFLNVFLAAIFARDGLSGAHLCELLEERDAGSITFTSAGVTWRGRTASAAAIHQARATAATSFGSCSFAEPMADLSALGLL